MLGTRVVVTEQYPKGLGRTVPEVDALLRDASGALLPQHIHREKLRFSMLDADMDRALGSYSWAILTGIEVRRARPPPAASCRV